MCAGRGQGEGEDVCAKVGEKWEGEWWCLRVDDFVCIRVCVHGIGCSGIDVHVGDFDLCCRLDLVVEFAVGDRLRWELMKEKIIANLIRVFEMLHPRHSCSIVDM